MSPDVGSSRGENRWTSPDVAWCRWALAPSLAPRDIVSGATGKMISAACQPMDDPAGSFIRLGWTRSLRLAMTLTGYRWRSRRQPAGPAAGRSRDPRSQAFAQAPGNDRFCDEYVPRLLVNIRAITSM